MPGSVQESVSIPGLSDEVARQLVNRFCRDAGTYRLESKLVSLVHDVIDLSEFFRRFPHVEGARHIRPVAPNCTAKITYAGITGRNFALANVMVRRRAIFAHADNPA